MTIQKYRTKAPTFISLALNGSVKAASCSGYFTSGEKET